MKLSAIFWLKILGTAILIMAISIILSIIEVFIYSLIVPGHSAAYYQAHALVSAPWVSAICGAVQMFFFVRNYLNKHAARWLLYTIALPTVYLVVDVAIIIAMQISIGKDYPIFILASLAKYAGAFTAYGIKRYKNHE